MTQALKNEQEKRFRMVKTVAVIVFEDIRNQVYETVPSKFLEENELIHETLCIFMEAVVLNKTWRSWHVEEEDHSS